MKRRDFLKKGTLAAGLASSPGFLSPILASETGSPQSTKSSQLTVKAPGEIRSAEYLRRARNGQDRPKAPVFAESYVSPEVRIKSMPLKERLRRGIVPRRGFCSIAPGSDALLISGNGPINIDMLCDPYSEQITFRHESVFVPHKHFEAPTIAGIFPQVRQMMLEGKYHEAAQFAYDEWHKSPMPLGGAFGGGPAFSMRLDSPKTASVKDYLRTIDFESTEIKVHWTDERGEWVRRTFTSRPDNVVVQWLAAPQGQPLNVRIMLQRSAGGTFGGMGFGGGGLGASLRGGTPGALADFFGRRGGRTQGEFHQDYNEKRLIFKGILDPAVNNSGYAGVTRVIRDGGSALMDGDTLVVAKASSVTLITRIEHKPD